MADLSLDVSQLKKFSTDLRRVGPALQKDFLKALGLAGDVVASAAKDKAGFSSRIPGTIKVRRRGVKVRVQAGGPNAPHAGPIDHQGIGGSFRHPVFWEADKLNAWVSQPAHPFLEPALEENVEKFDQLVIKVVDEAFRAGGFSG
jgi:hypothetical protein